MVNLKKRTWKVELPIGQSVEMTTKKLITDCVNFVGQSGLKTSEMYDRIKLLEKINSQDQINNGEIENYQLEDAEIALLKTLNDGIQWSFVNQCFLDFAEDLKNAN